jgi:hypothetical protein
LTAIARRRCNSRTRFLSRLHGLVDHGTPFCYRTDVFPSSAMVEQDNIGTMFVLQIWVSMSIGSTLAVVVTPISFPLLIDK